MVDLEKDNEAEIVVSSIDSENSINDESFKNITEDENSICYKLYKSSKELTKKYIPKPKRDITYELDHVLPKHYDTDFSPSNLKIYKDTRDYLLEKYKEGSMVYEHGIYGNDLSDDDFSILKPDSKKKFFRHERSLTDNSIPDSQGSCSTDSKHTENVQINNDIEKNVERSHSNLFFGSNNNTSVIDYSADRTQIPIKERLRQRKEQIKEKWKDHKWRNWALLCAAVVLIILLFFIIPTLIRILDYPHGPRVVVYEKLTDYVYPSLSAIRQDLVDPDTPEFARTKINKDGEVWNLVFSDEFNAEGRSFYPMMDQFWEGVDIHYAATKDLEWYDPDAITTKNGTLNIKMDAFRQHDLFYRSGMLQSWNKLCLTGGIIEISAKLPGSAYTSGLWPGLWLLGNLARPGYTASADGVWPYTYNECDAGITANQSSNDGISYLIGQRLNKCTCKGEDHPNRGNGRGAPEIDILEGAHSHDLSVSIGVASQTLQIAPFDIWYEPDYDFVEVYNFSKSNIGPFLGTSVQEMLSTATTLNETWFQNVVDPNNSTIVLKDRETYFQKYGVEYESFKKKRQDNYLTFLIGEEKMSTVTGNALHPNGNIGWREIPKEPMSLILNLGISMAWTTIEWANIVFPVEFQIDYVRVYQPPGRTKLTCDPQDYPTIDYINKHINAYMNPNLTTWEQAGYSFPKNKLTGC